jgi:hypothetical protein
LLLNVYISSATDGYFLLKAVEIPQLSVTVRGLDDIPRAVRAAAAALTGRAPEDFEISLNY